MLDQVQTIDILAKAARDSNAIVVSEIGSQTTWLHETGDHESYLYLSGPMGIAPSVALGVAFSQPHRPVLCLCGDGALAMNFSSLVTIANEKPKNLTLALMDNGVYDFTGQVTSPSQAVDWEKLISGFPNFDSYKVFDEKMFDGSKDPAFTSDGGLHFIHCNVKNASRKPMAFPFSGPQIYKRFRDYIEASS